MQVKKSKSMGNTQKQPSFRSLAAQDLSFPKILKNLPNVTSKEGGYETFTKLLKEKQASSVHTEDYTTNMKKLIGNNDLNSKEEDTRQTAANAEEEELRNMQLVKVLKNSEEYMQTNMNGLINNLTLSTVSAFELTTIMREFEQSTRKAVKTTLNVENLMS